MANSKRAAALVICLAAALPYVSTIDDYFVRDDFGVVQLLAGKPATSLPQWFVSSWMDDIWGSVPDEVRPFPAVSYQLTALGGAASPYLHHLLNIALHAVNGLLVFAIGLSLVRLSVPASLLAATLFVVLPVHGESVAWITGRVDSMPTCFYLASFLAFARWRAGDGRRLYVLSLAMLFAALFTKQTAITMVATLVAWDLLTIGWAASRRRALVVYGPIVVMTAAYLALRFVLFGQVVRESQLDPDGLRVFAGLVQHHLAYVVAGSTSASVAAYVALTAVLVTAGLLLRASPATERRHIVSMLLFFGPVWWTIGVAPTMVAGYESPRHVYLAAVGWVIVLGLLADLAWMRSRHVNARRAVSVVALLLLTFYLATLRGVVLDWNRMAAVSHRAVIDVEREALSAEPGSLLIVGAPARSWEWAMPFAVRPPFARVDLTARSLIVTPRVLQCCRSVWFDDTRRMLDQWRSRQPRAPVVLLRWDPDSGALSRLTDREYPALVSLMQVLPELGSADLLDATILRIVEQMPRR